MEKSSFRFEYRWKMRRSIQKWINYSPLSLKLPLCLDKYCIVMQLKSRKNREWMENGVFYFSSFLFGEVSTDWTSWFCVSSNIVKHRNFRATILITSIPQNTSRVNYTAFVRFTIKYLRVKSLKTRWNGSFWRFKKNF